MSTFVVFQDSPTVAARPTPSSTVPSPTVNSSDTSGVLAPASARTAANPLPATAEKENVHPVTGEVPRAGAGDAKSKKRKPAVGLGISGGGVLSPKSALADKKHKIKEGAAKLETKKRRGVAPKDKTATASKPAATKAATKVAGTTGPMSNSTSKITNKTNTSTTNMQKPKTSSLAPKQNVKRGSASSRGAGPKQSSATLPKVDEEDAERDSASQREAERITQAEIDSKVYELTIKPLADVTKAFLHDDGGVCLEEKPKQRVLKETSNALDLSAQPAVPLRDIEFPIKPRHVSAHRPLSSSAAAAAAPVLQAKTFSTPERKHIYAAFTFRSPSLTAERYIQSRAASEPVALARGRQV